MRYPFIRDHATQYPVTVLCHVLDVPRSGYYAWRQWPESPRAQEDRRLLSKIQRGHRDSKARYGSPRIMLMRDSYLCPYYLTPKQTPGILSLYYA